MTALVDTNVLVYRFDGRFPAKQAIATALLRQGIEDDSLRVPHQAIIEFVAVLRRVRDNNGELLLEFPDVLREAEELLTQFRVIYPNEAIVRLALRGTAAYRMSWFDAHLWAYAEYYGHEELLSEDFSDGRLYGSVRVRNPFAESG